MYLKSLLLAMCRYLIASPHISYDLEAILLLGTTMFKRRRQSRVIIGPLCSWISMLILLDLTQLASQLLC